MAFQWRGDTGLDYGLFLEFISRSANRSLASIEASERLADPEMNSYISWTNWQSIGNRLDHGIRLAVYWHQLVLNWSIICSDSHSIGNPQLALDWHSIGNGLVHLRSG